MPHPERAPTEKLLGFDAREMWLGPDGWSPERRAQYLLRQDAAKPLSTDILVWPSLFGDGLPDGDRAELKLDDAQLPDFHGPYQNLWEKLEELELHRRRIGQDGGHPHWVVAVTRVVSNPEDSEGIDDDAPSFVRAPAQEFLGYDVTDVWLLSGLSNCGYSLEETRSLGARFGPRLNRHHLFDDLETAFEFRSITDARVPEHAPFFVHGLWLVSKH